MSVPDVAVIAGTVSTSIFVASYLPMLVKAVRSRDLSSYSVLNLVLANVGNGVHSVYVFSLPAGPLWALHTFYLVSSGLMLWWWVRFRRPRIAAAEAAGAATEVAGDRSERTYPDDQHQAVRPSRRILKCLGGVSRRGRRGARPAGTRADGFGRRAQHRANRSRTRAGRDRSGPGATGPIDLRRPPSARVATRSPVRLGGDSRSLASLQHHRSG